MGGILLTGFEPFCNWAVNSSWEAARLLADQSGLPAVLLPVEHARAAETVRDLARTLRPEVMLLTGLANDTVPRLERIGRCGPLSPHGGPILRAGRWPFAATHDMAGARGLPLRASRNAGNYVCDTTYWAALGTTVPIVAFLHLPPLGSVWTARRLARVVEVVLRAGISAGARG